MQSLFSLMVGDSCAPFTATVEPVGAQISGVCSTPTAMLKEGTVAVFVNGTADWGLALTRVTDRIVVNDRLCKELEKLYYDAAKIRGYFCYASVAVPRSELDVNVHPDKTYSTCRICPHLTTLSVRCCSHPSALSSARCSGQ